MLFFFPSLSISIFFFFAGGVDTNPTAHGGVCGVFTGSEGEAQQGAVQCVCVPPEWAGWPCAALVPSEGAAVDECHRAGGTSGQNLRHGATR